MTTRRQLIASGLPAVLAGGAFVPFVLAGQGAGERISRPAPFQQQPPPPQGKLGRVLSGVWNGRQYTLPPLPYASEALEPHIDRQTMQIHHSRHHQAYVDGLNRAMKALEDAARAPEADPAVLYSLQRDLSFNYGGHILHSIFWATMGPPEGGAGESGQMGGEPVGELRQAIDTTYGGFENFRRHFVSVGKSVKGSGWALLTYDLAAGHVFVKAINDQDAYFPPGQLPVLGCDVWEHAYYLKYQNQREAYINAWFNVVDWQAADQLFQLNQFTGKPEVGPHEHGE